ncbi:MAG: hypothetical protein WCP17_03675 [bacterium]
MRIKKVIKKEKGFVILFAITISSILLAIAIGVSNIALKEMKFGTLARNTNDAFFAADTGVECALFSDKPPTSVFVLAGGTDIQCLGNTITMSGSFPSWSFIISGLGSEGQSCAIVSVVKTTGLTSTSTTVTSKGYNTGDTYCNSRGGERTEREIETNY